jgi:hypothetical protein
VLFFSNSFSKNNKKIILFYFSSLADDTYPDFIDKFAGETFSNCRVAISKKKPEHYSGELWLDDCFPVYNIETGKKEPSE